MKIRKVSILYLIILFFSTAFVSFGQNADGYVEGEIIVQLDKDASLEKVLSGYQSYGLSYSGLISARFNIYLLKFNPSRTSHQAILHDIKTDKAIINAQNNHYVSIRGAGETLPNDSLFYEQWSLENTGQFNGTVDADIDATDAWDLTTGGITAHGDTIVVAIIDGGSDLNHEDLDFWKNHAEIPNNNIDDDNNGYIDDYDGWNAYDHNGEIPIYNHGVHVTGIAAAKGNNDIGVSGVGWHYKILPVAGSSHTESVVVEALSYVYVVRERYDQTDGLEGAFVVADNCSFGVNHGQPEDYPIWEAMYDSLGEIGVLSIGATANNNWDIDEVGDVPTAFSTDYLISVTNTTRYDEKYDGAGYGDTTIDLGAPGTYIMSCRANNKYGFSSGTSMAAPHVTGVVGLLFSYADSTFLANYKNQPDVYAKYIKGYILDGVDTIDDLLGKSVSGGRLNAFNSLILMGDPPDPVPDLSTNKDSVDQILLVNNMLEDSLIISNTGGDTLVYTIGVANQSEWLLLSSSEGSMSAGEMDTIYLLFSSFEIDTGTYYDTIVIEGPEIPAKEIPVVMHVYTDVGIGEANYNSERIAVFPNPFSSEINFRFDDFFNQSITIDLFDQTGKKVESKSFRVIDQQFQIELGNNVSGLYYYQIAVDGKIMKTGKLIRL